MVKLTNGIDVNPEQGDLPEIEVGSEVVWSYTVTNTGNVTLVSLLIVDDAGTPQDLRDDFIVLRGGILAPGESIEMEAVGTAVAGEYINLASASADVLTGVTAALPGELLSTSALLATDDSGYLGVVPEPPVIPTELPNTGSGGVDTFLDTFGWRLMLAGLVAGSAFSFVGGARMLRRSR